MTIPLNGPVVKNHTLQKTAENTMEHRTKGYACSFRHDESQRGRETQSSLPATRARTQNYGKSSSKGKSPRDRSRSGKICQKPCSHYLTGNCTNPSCDHWHPPVCQFYKPESGCKFGEKCVFRHKEVGSQPDEKPKNSGGKGSVSLLKSSKQLGCAAPMLPNLRTNLRKKPCNKNDAAAEKHEKWRNMFISSKKRTKPHSPRLQKFGHYQRHLRRNLVKRICGRLQSIDAHVEQERSELS